ncbi:MAG: deoxyguanosinetriphosphate triphosphohydrolase [Rickettsiaceae bacterium]|nr:deoxyguanosinetriphosphate triphosphohydrolase [Rickettsiaceae bacterium]
MLATFATNPLNVSSRLYKEEPTPYRNQFQRDKDRIIHSNAFRRSEYKTQVFINHEGDHYRNRLTHSIEVASVARSIAGALALSEDLAECIALAHDLGHTPFGHAGEEALDHEMKDHGGFCHNAHSIKILTSLERRYAAYDGLNLTWEVLEGIAKHNGPVLEPLQEAIEEYNKIHNLKLNEFSSAEAQVASFSDDIAYIGHDLEDGIRSKLFTIEDMKELDFIYEFIEIIRSKYKDLEPDRTIYEAIRYSNHYFINDLLKTSKENIEKYGVKTPEDVRLLGKPLVEFSQEATMRMGMIKDFLRKMVYYNHYVSKITFKCKKIIHGLFEIYMESPECLPDHWQMRIKKAEKSKTRIISDYIAGMTDRFAIKEYSSFHNLNFDGLI